MNLSNQHSINLLNLPTRARNALSKWEIRTIEDLQEFIAEADKTSWNNQLPDIKGVGQKSREQILDGLRRWEAVRKYLAILENGLATDEDDEMDLALDTVYQKLRERETAKIQAWVMEMNDAVRQIFGSTDPE